jgi:hypothetical protein
MTRNPMTMVVILMAEPLKPRKSTAEVTIVELVKQT